MELLIDIVDAIQTEIEGLKIAIKTQNENHPMPGNPYILGLKSRMAGLLQAIQIIEAQAQKHGEQK